MVSPFRFWKVSKTKKFDPDILSHGALYSASYGFISCSNTSSSVATGPAKNLPKPEHHTSQNQQHHLTWPRRHAVAFSPHRDQPTENHLRDPPVLHGKKETEELHRKARKPHGRHGRPPGRILAFKSNANLQVKCLLTSSFNPASNTPSCISQRHG